MKKPDSSKVPAHSRFQKLVDDISKFYLSARGAQVLFGWETGRRVVEEEQNGEMRAAYGAALIPTLAKILTKKFGPGFSENGIRKARQFFLQNPIQPISVELDWSDYVELLPVKDAKTRKQIEKRILEEGLNSQQVRQLVHQLRDTEIKKKSPTPAPKKYPPLKHPTDLRLFTYRSVDPKTAPLYEVEPGQVLLDFGFFFTLGVPADKAAQVTVTDKPAYTYQALVARVVDGDTLKVVIRLGFNAAVEETLRLRGIDTPELGTPEGERAKKYVSGLLPVASPIIIKTSKTDQHGRFVADVFYKPGAQSPEDVLPDGIYLNQQLLDEGYAVRAGE